MNKKITPGARRLIVWTGAALVITSLALVAGSGDNSKRKKNDETVKHVLTDFNTRELGVDSLASGIKLLHSREDALRREIASLKRELELVKKSAGFLSQGRDPALEARLKTADELIGELRLIRNLLPKNLRTNIPDGENADGSNKASTATDGRNTKAVPSSLLSSTSSSSSLSSSLTGADGNAQIQGVNGTIGGIGSQNSANYPNSIYSSQLSGTPYSSAAFGDALGLPDNSTLTPLPKKHIIAIKSESVINRNGSSGDGQSRARGSQRGGNAQNSSGHINNQIGTHAGRQSGEHSGAHTGTYASKSANTADEKNHEPYIPSGSIISGYLITGLDAPTSESTKNEPFPVLISIDRSSLLPNSFRADLEECTVLAAAYGDMSSERVYMRAESLSCITDAGESLELDLKGYAVGSDGKAGLRGRLVSRQGRLIARSLTAGFLEGLAGAFDVNPVPTINTTGSDRVEYASVYNSRALAGAGARGTSKALERIADFYMKLADNMFPVLEIDAARRVDIVLTQGTKLGQLLHPKDPVYGGNRH